MLQYNELGRHTPPPPPYSLSKRDPTKIQIANQPPAPPPPPPPPPPYLTSAPKCNCAIPTIDSLRRRTVAPEIRPSSACHHSNPAFPPPVGFERDARPVVSNTSPQSIEDYPRSWKKNWRTASLPAHPVEPKWTPAGIPGLPGPLNGAGATMPPVQFPLERLGHSVPRQLVSSAETRVGSDCRKTTSASSNTLSTGQGRANCSTRPPPRIVPLPGAVKAAKPIPPSRKQSSKDITSLANIITAPSPGAIKPTKRPCPAPAIPSRLTAAPKSKAPDPSENIQDVKKPPQQLSDSSNLVDLSESEDKPTHPTSVLKTRNPGPIALIPPDGIQLSKDRKTRFPGHNRNERVSRLVTRKGLFSSRYEPYKRPQPSIAGNVKWRVGSGSDGKAERELVMNAVEEDEGENGEEGKGEGGEENKGDRIGLVG
ncbi:hypothetical protein BDR22DRAFT_352193 [Usnea florida]